MFISRALINSETCHSGILSEKKEVPFEKERSPTSCGGGRERRGEQYSLLHFRKQEVKLYLFVIAQGNPGKMLRKLKGYPQGACERGRTAWGQG